MKSHDRRPTLLAAIVGGLLQRLGGIALAFAGKASFHIGEELGLVLLERQHVMAALVEHGLGDAVYAIRQRQRHVVRPRVSVAERLLDDEAVASMVTKVEATFGGIDILVSNAGEAQPFSPDWFAVEPLIAAASLDWGFAIKMDNPSEVGVDRLVNGMAAHQKYGGPAVVIDFGTATTFDVIDAQGSYGGGVIAPGINLSVEALHMAAARLPRGGIGRQKLRSRRAFQ